MQKRHFEKREIRHYWLAQCSVCGIVKAKQNLAALYVRAKTDGTPKKLCHICYDCLATLMEELELSM